MRYRISPVAGVPVTLINELNRVLGQIEQAQNIAVPPAVAPAPTVTSVPPTIVSGGGTVTPAAPEPYIVAITWIGQPTAAEVILRHIASVPYTLPAGLANSELTAGTATNANATFTINKNGAGIGSFTYVAATTTGTFTFAADVSFAVGDILTVVAPNPPDATLSDLGITILGSR